MSYMTNMFSLYYNSPLYRNKYFFINQIHVKVWMTEARPKDITDDILISHFLFFLSTLIPIPWIYFLKKVSKYLILLNDECSRLVSLLVFNITSDDGC